MSLEDDCKHLMYCRSKIKEYRRSEQGARLRIVEYLKNHNQEGVVFKHNNKKVTLMVDSKPLKKSMSKREKEKNINDVLTKVGTVQNIHETTQKIISGLQQISLTNKPPVDKLKLKVQNKS
jgi:hypothetical protein